MEFRVLFFFVSLCVQVYCTVVQLSCAQVRGFVDGHNRRRLALGQGKVPGQPPAADMTLMIWDEELAQKAAGWAKQNKFAHNADREIRSRRFRVGENLYISSSTVSVPVDVEAALTAWFDEHNDYQYGPLTSAQFEGEPQIGHYTQMAWASSLYVGCAVSSYQEGSWHHHLVVCNYGPAGNMLGSAPYVEGNPLTQLKCGCADCTKMYGKRC